jgi:DNA-binding transcriptional regulator YiaG
MATVAQDIIVFADKRVLPEAHRFFEQLGARTYSVALEHPKRLTQGRRFVVYLQGHEALPEVRSFLREVGTTNYDWVLLYVAHHSLELAAKIGFLAGQELPKKAEFAFDADEVKHWLKARNALVHGFKTVRRSFSGTDLSGLRKRFGLTQEQLAAAVNVTTRTVQNWERDVATTQMERKTRDLRELSDLLRDYVIRDKESEWLRSEQKALRGKRPLDLLLEGKIRDLIVEFRRLQEGQPV